MKRLISAIPGEKLQLLFRKMAKTVHAFTSRPSRAQQSNNNSLQPVCNLFDPKYQYILHIPRVDADKKFAQYLIYLEEKTRQMACIQSIPAELTCGKWFRNIDCQSQFFIGFVDWDDMTLFKIKFDIK